MNLSSSQKSAVLVGTLVVAKLGIHLYANALGPYEFHRDEFLYFAMGDHLRLFGMDFPPFIAILSEFVRGLLGDSLPAIRFVPALTGTGLMIIAAYTARELGGATFAQTLAVLSVLCSTLFLRASNLFQPVVFDQFWWTLALFFLVKLGVSEEPKWWIAYGIAVGLGLLTKFSILVFGFATLVALVLTHERRWLKTRWPWLAASIALVIGSPSLIGQIRLGFPVLGQIDAIGVQFEEVSYLGFVLDQPKMVGGFILAAVGVWALVAGRFERTLRLVGLTTIVAFLTLLLLHGKAYYIGPIYPVLFGAGAVVFERIRHTWAGPVVRWGMVVYLVVYAFALLPLGVPILKPADMESYLVRMGLQESAKTNIGEQERIPQDYADMLNWKEQVEEVAGVFRGLTADERRDAVIFASNYGEAGAVDFYGPRLGLPRAIAITGTYWHFGPGTLPGEVLVSIGVPSEDLKPYYDSVTQVATVTHPYAVEEQRDVPIVVSRNPGQTLQAMWPAFEGRH